MPFFCFCFFLSETTEKGAAHKIWLLRKQVRKRTVDIEYYFLLKPNHPTRAVKKFLSSRLLLKSRWLWTSHQGDKFLRAEASRDILKFRVSGMPFPEFFKRYFPPQTPCCFVRIHVHARLGTMSSKCPRCSTTSHSSNVSQI